MSIYGVVGAFEGLTLESETGGILFEDRVIGSIEEGGGSFVVRLLVHALDLEPLSEEYPFVCSTGGGWIELLIADETDDSQISALMECLGSAVDRAQETDGE